jgi:hypothetical protein
MTKPLDPLDQLDSDLRKAIARYFDDGDNHVELVEALWSTIEDYEETIDIDEQPIGFAPGGTPIYPGDDR